MTSPDAHPDMKPVEEDAISVPERFTTACSHYSKRMTMNTFRGGSDPLPAPPTLAVHPRRSATSFVTFDDAASRSMFKYPRFSTTTTLDDTGGPGFSIEELTSTEVSEDEDAIINEPVLRRRVLSKASLRPPTIQPTSLPSIDESDRPTTVRGYIVAVVRALLVAVAHYLTGNRRSSEENNSTP